MSINRDSKILLRCPSCNLVARVSAGLEEYTCPQCHQHLLDATHDAKTCKCALTAIVHYAGSAILLALMLLAAPAKAQTPGELLELRVDKTPIYTWLTPGSGAVDPCCSDLLAAWDEYKAHPRDNEYYDKVVDSGAVFIGQSDGTIKMVKPGVRTHVRVKAPEYGSLEDFMEFLRARWESKLRKVVECK